MVFILQILEFYSLLAMHLSYLGEIVTFFSGKNVIFDYTKYARPNEQHLSIINSEIYSFLAIGLYYLFEPFCGCCERKYFLV